MMRQLKIVLEKDSVKRIAADPKSDQADLFDKLIQSINALNECNEREGAPARLRVLNKEPKRHRKRSMMISSASESDSNQSDSNQSGGRNSNSNSSDDDQEPGVQLWISASSSSGSGRKQPTWDKVIQDKAKMIEMHAF